MDRKSKKIVTILFILTMLSLTFVVPHKTTVQRTGIEENHAIYQNDKIDEVKEIYITIFPSDGSSKKYDYTFQELNETIDTSGEDVAIKVLFQEGKEGEPGKGYYGYGLTDINGVMELRGQSSRLAKQKSYKIELNKKAGLWRGYKTINLNKHPFDSLRMRNKLSFDFLKTIPAITSLRTSFVHLYIKDYSQGDFTQGFEDYGLYTQVENPDTDFLKNHGLDPRGHLYKVENFEFFRYPEQLKLETDKAFQEEIFEDILEIKGNRDHTKLIEMLEEVNSEYIHINDVIAKYFDRENYLTWLAINILTGNVDTGSRNFLLYSPSDSDRWYFMPWDFDKAWGAYRHASVWQEGVSIYWGVVLHHRFLRNKDNLADLTAKVESLSKILTPQNTGKFINLYKPIVFDFLSKMPDNQYHSYTLQELDREFADLPLTIEQNKQKYYENLEKPMPVHMGKPTRYGDYYSFTWTDSYDFQGDPISYSIEISDSPSFEKIIFRQVDIKENECIVSDLTPGKYYWRLELKDKKGNKQIPFDILIDRSNHYYYGVQEFFIQ